MSTDSAQVVLEQSAGLAVVKLANPAKRNAVTASMWRQLRAIMTELNDKPDLRAVMIRGAGDIAFSAGADISEFDRERSGTDAVQAYDGLVEAACVALEGLPVPTLAMIHGACLGAALSVVGSCDLRVCDDQASFALPAARLSLGYDFSGIARLAGLVGITAAKEILLAGERIPATRALQIGLVQHVAGRAELADHAGQLARRLRDNAPLTLRAMKACFAELRKPSAERDIARCQVLVEHCNASDDYREGRKAFAERRPAAFKGR